MHDLEIIYLSSLTFTTLLPSQDFYTFDNKVVISFCLSVCFFDDHNSGTPGPLSSNLDWGT